MELSDDEVRALRKTLKMGESLVEMYQAALDQLDLEIDFNLTWPNGEKANAREMFLKNVRDGLELLGDGE